MKDNSTIEKRALYVGAVLNVIMAVAGWGAYALSQSQALLLDGNFSFVAFVSTLVAVKIAAVKANKSATFPFGQFVYEALYSFVLGLLTVGIILAALVQNSIKIIEYVKGEQFVPIQSSILIYYTLFTVVLGLLGGFFFRNSNKKLGNTSTILKAYATQVFTDAYLSAGVGVALILMAFVKTGTPLAFLLQIGDAVIVVLMCLLLGYQPLKLIKEAFVEMAGGKISDQTTQTDIETIIKNHIPEKMVQGIFVSKTGSSFLAVAEVEVQFIKQQDAVSVRQRIEKELKEKYGYVFFEIIFS